MQTPKGLELAAVALAVLLAPAAAEAVTAEQVAERLRGKITRRWEVKNLDVKVVPYDSQQLTDQGRFKAISVRADAATQKGITIRPMFVKGTDVAIDLPPLFGPDYKLRTRHVGKTEMHVEMAEDDVNEGLSRAQDVVPDLKAELENGQIVLTGTYRFIIGNKFRMAGKLECKDGYRINFVPTAVKVNRMPVPVSVLKPVLGKINPLLDTSEVVLSPRISSIVIKDGKMIVE